MAKSIQSGAPKLRQLVAEVGETKAEAYLKLWLIDLNEILDLKKPLNARQIDDLAFRIVDKYRSLNIADINLIFERVKNGDQGKISYQITVPTVMNWFKEYFDQRCNTAFELNHQQHVQKKSAFAGTHNAQRTKDAHKAAAKWYKDKTQRAQAQARVNKAKNNPPKNNG